MTIWVVRLGDDLYVRSVNGRTGAWFRGMLRLTPSQGRIRAGGVEKDVTFVDAATPPSMIRSTPPTAPSTAVYAASIVNPIISPEARSATIKLVPRSTALSFWAV